jgi:hypothetical protein
MIFPEKRGREMDQHTKEEWVREASVSSSRINVRPSGRKQSVTHCMKEEQNFKDRKC